MRFPILAATALAVLHLTAATAAEPKITFLSYPEQAVHAYPLNDQRGVYSLVLNGMAIANQETQTLKIQELRVELLRQGQVVDQRTVAPQELDATAKSISAAPPFILQAAYGSLLKTPNTAPAASSQVAANKTLILPRQVFAYRGPRDQVQLTLVGTLGDQPFSKKATVAIDAGYAKGDYQFPLAGRSFIGAGASLHSGHRWAVFEEFALDIVKLGGNGTTFAGDGQRRQDFYAYGTPVRAALAGRVVALAADVVEDDSGLRRKGESLEDYEQRSAQIQAEALAKGFAAVAGNHVVIQHANGEYSLYAHLQPGSLKVKVGDMVTTGQTIGAVGTSGNSTEPHLHFQVMDRFDGFAGVALPVQFTDALVYGDGPRAVQTGDLIDAP